jgi:peptidoglycan/LPS O-acetylase OafA/YrhL
MDDWRTNNFDLIRLGAALQVAIGHTASYYGLPGKLGIVGSAVSVFPGVPIFFVISGLLISRSYESSGVLRDYFANRALRIFPALWVCLVVTVLLTVVFALPSIGDAGRLRWFGWWAAQMSAAQFWGPDFLHELPTGGLNVSLWTITIELQFYACVPLLYALLGLRRSSGNLAVVMLAVPSLVLYLVLTTRQEWLGGQARFAIAALTLPAYLWIFALGILIQRNLARFRPLLSGKLHWWSVGYAVVTVLAHRMGWRVAGNTINPLSLVVLAGLVSSAAFTCSNLGERLLKRNDLSYGLYIYHAPVLNVLLAAAAVPALWSIPACVGTTLALAALSWWLVEKPFLRRKRHALREYSGAAPLAPAPAVAGLT